MKIIGAIFVFCVAMQGVASAQATTRPIAQIDRALVVSIDGLRPDMLLRANTPNLHALMTGGCYTLWGRTTALAITLPSHVTMLTGLLPRRHGIEWNRDLPTTEPIYPTGDTLFEVAKRAGYSTAMAAGKSKFVSLDKPGSIDWVYLPSDKSAEDDIVAKRAVQIIREHRPQVMFVHLPSVDNVGHLRGWGSPAQISAVEGADVALGRVLDALRGTHDLDRTLILVTADHGGAGLGHGPEDARARHIPWIVDGPGIRKSFDLTRFSALDVNTQDTFATVCWVLGITYNVGIDGYPVYAILDAPILMPLIAKV